MTEYRIFATLKNGRSYAMPKEKARSVLMPFMKKIASAHLQYREGEGPWCDGPRVDFEGGSFEVLFGKNGETAYGTSSG